jgi:hypothetical protein
MGLGSPVKTSSTNSSIFLYASTIAGSVSGSLSENRPSTVEGLLDAGRCHRLLPVVLSTAHTSSPWVHSFQSERHCSVLGADRQAIIHLCQELETLGEFSSHPYRSVSDCGLICLGIILSVCHTPCELNSASKVSISAKAADHKAVDALTDWRPGRCRKTPMTKLLPAWLQQPRQPMAKLSGRCPRPSTARLLKS